MTDVTTEMKKVCDLRHRMTLNRAKGLPADEGISEEELEEAVRFLMKDRTSAIAEKATATKKAKEEPVDLKAMLAKVRKNKEG